VLGAKRSASMHEFGTAGSIVEGVSAEAVDVDEAGDNAWRVRRQMTIIDVSGTGGRRSGAMDSMEASATAAGQDEGADRTVTREACQTGTSRTSRTFLP